MPRPALHFIQLAGTYAVAALGAMGLCVPASAQPKLAPETVEAILVQSLLEQAAFRACAALDKDPAAAGFVTRGWQLDLKDASDVLRQAGFDEGYIRSLSDRLDIEKATPKFADRNALTAYCALLGDWNNRRAMLIYSVPQMRLRQALKP